MPNYVDLTYRKKKTKPMSCEDRQKYNEKYREENSYSISCECGASVKAMSFYNHKKTKQHIEFVKSKLAT